MASHGVPRAATKETQSEEGRQKELGEIQAYQNLVEEITTQINQKEYTPEVLRKTAELLKKNPEYYTIWNHRRRIYAHEFKALQCSVETGEISEEIRISNILDIIRLDLGFLFPLLLKFPKCYWIWNHRLWLLDQSTLLLPPESSRPLWSEELGLVGKMLTRDSRNFHGWGYRRIVIQNLESSRLNGDSMVRDEFDYTTKMIGANLSNFSAWHNRSKLILRMLNERNANDEERKATLDEELKLIHKALFDPYDQSLWFYHQNLMCIFDRGQSQKTMAPNLSDDNRLKYIEAEREFIEELLEDVTDCKWIYQTLIELILLETKLTAPASYPHKAKMTEYITQLKLLDPLRQGRWAELEMSLSKT